MCLLLKVTSILTSIVTQPCISLLSYHPCISTSQSSCQLLLICLFLIYIFPHFLLYFLYNLSAKEPTLLTCRFSHNPNCTECILMVQFNMSLCLLYLFTLAGRLKGLIRLRLIPLQNVGSIWVFHQKHVTDCFFSYNVQSLIANA